jgi:hypothetical protein
MYVCVYIYIYIYIYLTVREEHKLRVLRRIFGPKRDGVTGGWREEDEVGGTCGTNGREEERV